ncbi:hypothetical protein DEU56DRAFT_984296 [Suillus clintonianus]|uniref:uncharacterized protein n=1 Tax=Suillus clintonianus TaxID=1904413 RepID=UPI001B87E5AA|nr:uncharacterized protein DEU56DRAFT_984296 [Suillus clintonianus]KAG2121596.1 hypothetical protein DEU56DRAFT_984296 [Suillus clintonianus]
MSSELDTNANMPFHRPGDEPFQHPVGNMHAHGLAQYSPEAAEAFSFPSKPESKHDALPPLFQTPQSPLASICPQRWPGIDTESTNMLLKVLEDNHSRWHIFFNYRRFHKRALHAVHHLLAIWAMGASAKIISSAYATHCIYQRPAFESPSRITHRNFNEHLGDERFYSAYSDFFASELGTNGFARTFGQYVLAPSANYLEEPHKEKDGHPEMLVRFIGGLLHPLIHTGYGAEFGLLGVSAEGLAMTAVHPAKVHALLPPSYFSSPMKAGTLHALSILALVAKDERFEHIKKSDEADMLTMIVSSHNEALRAFAEMWDFDVSNKEGVAKAVEELVWLNSIIYGVGGMTGKRDTKKVFNADFFLMHLVTSTLFLSSLVTSLDQNSRAQTLLLRAYFAVSLAHYLARGRPVIDIAKFYSDTSGLLLSSGRDIIPGPRPSPDKHTLPDEKSPEARTPNPWLSVIQTTLVHPNEHLCKIQRALAHYASLYSLRGQGWFVTREQASVAMDNSKLEDAEHSLGLGELDGTLFLRVAMLTAHTLGWMREGEEKAGWDSEGFYEK